MIILGVSPTRVEPAAPPGIEVLGARPLAHAGPRKTAWEDYMLASRSPAWSLRLTTKSGFEMGGSDRSPLVPPPPVASEPALKDGAHGKFGFSTSTPEGQQTSLAPTAWSALGEAGARSALLPTPIATLRDSTTGLDAAAPLLDQLSAPPSSAGAAAGATVLPKD